MEITNTENVIDSRDIIERIEDLENDYEYLADDLEDAEGKEEIERAQKALDGWDGRHKEELEDLQNLAAACENFVEWKDCAQLINEDYFTEYCEELCKNIGEIPRDLPWYIADHIDWDGVADEIKADYAEVDFDGKSYFLRA